MIDLEELGAQTHAMLARNGFSSMDPTPMSQMARLMLISMEVAEAATSVRDGEPTHIPSVIGKKPEGLDIELADIVWKVAELAYTLDLDLEEAIYRKAAYNEQRIFTRGQGLKRSV